MARSSSAAIAAALLSGFLAVVSLVLPWFEILGNTRSSIDLISSAGALDVIDGLAKVLVIAGWLLAPVLVSVAMFAGAAGKHRLSAVLLLPIGILLLVVFLIGAAVGEIGVAWGAVFGAVFAALTIVFAMMVLVVGTIVEKPDISLGSTEVDA